MDIIYINDRYLPEWMIYFKKQGIIIPVKGVAYTIREIVNYPMGEKGLLLNEIVNPPTPRYSPTTGIPGSAEQAWAMSRFTDINGNKLVWAQLITVEKSDKIGV